MPRAHPDSLQNENVYVDVLDGTCKLDQNAVSKHWVGIIGGIIYHDRNLSAGSQLDKISDTLKKEFDIITSNVPPQDLEISIKVTIIAKQGKTLVKHIQTFSFPDTP
tara:strand:+ start:187 stop:507 length:321 start_codon:yes stop_codon:yes gene_type:complete